MRRHRRLLPLLLLLLPRLLPVVVVAVLAIGFGRHAGWDTLARHQGALLQAVAAHPAAAAALYLLTYILMAALSFPNAAIQTVTGGLLFGTLLGCVLTVVGATTGAALLLLAARSVLGDILRRRGGRTLEVVRDRLRQDGFSYLLALRLVPLVPFWAVNLAAAVCGMRLHTFVPATVLGIIPASFVMSSIGSGVGGVLAEGSTPNLSVLLAPRIVLPLLALAVLSLLPPLLRRRSGFHA